MSFEIKDPTFSWPEWVFLIAFTIGLIMASSSRNLFTLLIGAFAFGLLSGRLIYRWENKAKTVGIIAMCFGSLGLLLASFNILTILLSVAGTKISYDAHKNKKIDSVDF